MVKNKDLILCRGLQGSGKSTFANVIGKAVCCADDYFIKNNIYKWDKDKLNIAHKWCYKKCELMMKYNITPIIVANTFVKEEHLTQYIELGKKYNYRIFSIIVENRFNTKNIHGVDQQIIENNRNKFDIKL